MELYIQVVDGQPINHPILGDNFRQAFPDVDTDNLPDTFARFERIPCPAASEGMIITNAECRYEWNNGTVKDVWYITEANNG
jgi:hypothetical protein